MNEVLCRSKALQTTKLMELLTGLETFLTEQRIVWERLTHKEYLASAREWIDFFGTAFGRGMKYREGTKAIICLGEVAPCQFLILSLNDCGVPPFGRTNLQVPPFAYRCGPATVPYLGAFNELEFAVAESDSSWTITYTHEDFSMGGPYFAMRTWVGDTERTVPTRNRRHGKKWSKWGR